MNTPLTPRASRPQQQGAAALVVTLLLFFAMSLSAVYANRSLVVDQRLSANQYRSTQALEAAEAGLEWAQAQLNQPGRIGPDCLPTANHSAASFQARYLRSQLAHATFTPITWLNAGTAVALQPSCVRSAAGWACSCPSNTAASLTPPNSGTDPAPAFTIRFEALPKPGMVRVVSIGCTQLAGACVPGARTLVDATAQVQVDLALLPALRTPPVAALTVQGQVNAGGAALGLHNPDPATGWAVHAGGPIATAQARITAPAGAPTGSALAEQDAALASQTPEHFFLSHFGLDKAHWRDQPGVAHVDCHQPCAAALQAAVDAAPEGAMVWVDGDLALSGPLTLGTPQAPVVIGVQGQARLDGAVALHGVLYAQALSWTHPAPGALLRGAAMAEGDYQGDGTPDLFFDTTVLATLQARTGRWARVSGSWRDF